MKRFIFVLTMILLFALYGCGAKAPLADAAGGVVSPAAGDEGAQTTQAPTQSPSAQTPAQTEPEVKTFSVEPVKGWTYLDAASTDVFKSYNLLEPYVGSANFWVMYVGDAVYSGTDTDARAAVEQHGFSEYELISVEKLDYEMPTVRVVANTVISGMKFTLGHYFIDAPGENDIYFQLSAAPENFSKAQPLWEEALNTLAVE